MAKKIVLLSDGTGNAAGKVWRTNVWRLFQALELKGSDQIAIYDDGVGTSSFKPFAILGGVFGWGLKRNVINLYKFLCRNYQSGDQIFAFGFSRGAFTIRVVVGLVLNQGLVHFANEAELDKKARAAFRAYRHNKYPIWNLQYPFRLAQIILDKRFYKSCETPISSIEFVGVWDTVAAYGLPIDEMTRGVSEWLWPLELPNKNFNTNIKKARHALAIDDERATFHPVLWDETPSNTQPSGVSRPTDKEQLLQVWFAGVHSNVGGGYPDDSLANIALAWMMAEAKDAGLQFKDMPDAEPDALLSTDSAKDKDGRLYDSRSGLGGYYRYSPRKMADFYAAMPKHENWAPKPKIHEAVFGRIKVGAHFYAPIVLPADYEVVTSTDVLVSPKPPPPIAPILTNVEPNSAALAEGKDSGTLRHGAQEEVWDYVWRKRAIYFLTVFATGYLLLYPLFRDSYPFQELRTPFRWASDTIRLVGTVLPGLASRWIDAYARDPAWFLVWALLVAFLTWVSAKLAGSIKDRMRLLWIKYLPASNSPAAPKSPPVSSLPASTLFVGVILYLLCYPLFGWGWGLGWLALPEPANDILLDYTAQPVRVVLATFLVVYFLPGAAVRKLRQAPWYQAALHAFKYGIAPAVSAVGLLYLAVAFGSHYHFNMRDSLGSFCTENTQLNTGHDGFQRVGGKEKVELVFDTAREASNLPNNICISTGVFLRTGERYLVSVKRLPEEDNVSATGKWTFFGEESYMGGQPVSHLSFFRSVALALLFPLRRTFDRPWGSIILRIGGKGNEEDFLDRPPPEQTDDRSAYDINPPVPDKAEFVSEGFRPKRDGELFIYLNKPMLGFWGYETLVADWIGNTGKAKVTVEK
ncbi:MAG TPA: DUF2235 domain-containing protein [Rhodopseudomonas sp.]|uniref:DUF2235 domain-containing protein n=1 Tax=Rhodopseudomonas sp. TaxID=1078 RepID=UPI002EDB9A8C